MQIVQLPPWLDNLRRSAIVERVQNDPRSLGQTLLGVTPEIAMREAAGGGQADFDASWGSLSPEDRVLLYAYFFQKRHLEELTSAFLQLFSTSVIPDPIAVDLGCGPFTGGLALAGALGRESRFDYIGVDRSRAMRELGERLASAGELPCKVTRRWATDISSISWNQPRGWRPVIVIVSYLFASPTLDVGVLVDDLHKLLARLGLGPVTVLYTNSSREAANTGFPGFRAALQERGFKPFADDIGSIEIERFGGGRELTLRYALFHRPRQRTLFLEGD